MKEDVIYPEYIGVSDVTTRSFEHMRVEAYSDSTGRTDGSAPDDNSRS